MDRPDDARYRRFRRIWGLLAIGSWVPVVWLSSHGSSQPSVWIYSWGRLATVAGGGLIAGWLTYSLRQPILERWFRRRRQLALLSASAVMSVALAEAVLRLCDPFGISYHYHMACFGRDLLVDEDLFYRLRPDLRVRYQGVAIHTNRHGLRDRPITAKADGELRVLLLGDSVAFGWGVEQELVVSARLEQRLARRLNRPVRVINAGVCSYNTVQEFDYLQRDGLALDPDIVLLLSTNNDIELNQPVREKSWIHQSAATWARSRILDLARFVGRDPTDEEGWYDEARQSPGYSPCLSALEDMAALCSDRGIGFVAFHFRWIARPHTDLLLRDLEQSARPFPVEDVSSAFSGKDHRQYFNSVVDSHPDAEAHDLLATFMERMLILRGVIQQPM